MLASIGWLELLRRISIDIKLSLEMSDHIRPADCNQILSLLKAYTTKREDFIQYVQFSQTGYTKNLVTEIDNNLGNIIVMCWAPRQESAFHGHEGSQCFVKVLQGELVEERIGHPNCLSASECKHGERKIMQTNEVTYIDDHIGCHRVTNKSSETPAVTLHVYTPPYRKCRLFELTGANLADGQQFQEPLICMEHSRTIDVTFDNV